MMAVRVGMFVCLLLCAAPVVAETAIEIEAPMPPPPWAVLERELLRANTAACREFFERYFDERGFLLCVERWGGDDGPDDAIECCNDWPILHALGASDAVLAMYKKAWEGHLRQYTLARTTEVPFARDGMYYKEFPVKFDWLHNGEGLTVFSQQALSDPDEQFGKRVRRYAGFYMNQDPGADNYDPRHKIIRSMINGSRGPMLRKATALDWAGDPIEVAGRFHPGHGERNYEEMLAHFEDYNDVAGDNPLNLLATSLALNAYMLTGEGKYKEWLLEYVDAWLERMRENGGIIPSNVGLDGKIGSAAGGRWYGGVYGWGFSVKVPQTGATAHRNRHHMGLTGFGNALLLTGDQRYVDAWRNQMDVINAQGRMIDGRMMYPQMYGDDGWYGFTPQKYDHRAEDLWYWSMRDDDLARLPQSGWRAWLRGKGDGYPVRALQADFAAIRRKVQAMWDDTTTPDTRLADDPMRLNPCNVRSLIQLMLGGIHPRHEGAPLHCRVRYFDPRARRAGLPPDVAALVDRVTADETALTLLNINQRFSRILVVQAGAYGEHQFLSLQRGGETVPVNAPLLTVRLAPGAGERLTIKTRRYANQPTLLHPWDRKWQ